MFKTNGLLQIMPVIVSYHCTEVKLPLFWFGPVAQLVRALC